MGFDDEIFDTKLEENVMKTFKENPDLLLKYSHCPTIEKLSKWEKNKKYNGYSLAYNLLYDIRYTSLLGANPFPNPHPYQLVSLNYRCRRDICKMFMNIMDSDYDDYVVETYTFYKDHYVQLEMSENDIRDELKDYIFHECHSFDEDSLISKLKLIEG